MIERIDNTPFREAVLRSERSHADLALEAGWTRKSRHGKKVGDITTLKRRLGIVDSVSGDGSKCIQTTITYDDGIVLCRVLDLDPVDVGV